MDDGINRRFVRYGSDDSTVPVHTAASCQPRSGATFMSPLWWAIAGVAAVGLYFWYASIVRRRIRVLEALAGIDVQLQQRHDLIPNVLTIARRFMDHERGLLTEIT